MCAMIPMLRYFSNGIPRSSVSSPLAARITRVRGARPAVFYKDGKPRVTQGQSVTPSVAVHASHALIRPANDARRRRSADEATKKEGLFLIHPPPRLPLASSRVRPSLPDRARAQGIRDARPDPAIDAHSTRPARGRDECPRVPTRSHARTRTHPSIPRIVRPSPPSRPVASRRVHHRRPRHRRQPAAPGRPRASSPDRRRPLPRRSETRDANARE